MSPSNMGCLNGTCTPSNLSELPLSVRFLIVGLAIAIIFAGYLYSAIKNKGAKE